MGCVSSKEAEDNTNTVRIQITSQQQVPAEDVLFVKSTHLSFARSNSEPFPSVGTVSSSKQGLSIRPPSNKKNSVSTSSLAQSLRKNKLVTPEQKARRSMSGIICVEPHLPRDVTHDIITRQVSASSRATTDSGYEDESRPSISSASRRTENEIIQFITEKSSSDRVESVMVAERPTTPKLLIAGISYLPPIRKSSITPKHTNLPGAMDAQNILEKSPLPPIHSKLRRTNSSVKFTEENTAMQIEQSFDVIERSASRGGLAFDILLDVSLEKKNGLKPIEFCPEGLSSKKVFKTKTATSKLTKEEIEAKLAAAESRRKKREQKIIDNLIEQREIEEKKMKERYEQNQKVIEHRETTLGERMRTRSNNREALINAKVIQAHRVQEKVENARVSRKYLSQNKVSECKTTMQS
ncbi:hypothetical protein LOD99_14032 [Oopsacas minuta]|uniref:Uncharacterized protein n=1 Tax=Oopsacas minuta TaxID=111878 RepID=A0AAV7KKD5_9METZ|nr:hypothetical protein LOD99_14032 [Oopsacas minuta]